MARQENLSFMRASVTGSSFSGSTSDFVAYPFAVHGYFNWRNVAIARAVCAAGDTVAEIGANIGTETVAYSDIVGEGGAVYAFEPFPANVALLRHNAARTRNRNVTVFPMALGAHAGQIQFASPDSYNSGSGYPVGALGAAIQRVDGVVTVECATLDRLAPERPLRLVIIDAEGHEDLILEGAEAVLRRDQPVIVLEAIEHLLVRAGSDCARLASHLRELGYALLQIRRLGLTPIDSRAGGLPPASDWLAVPEREAGIVPRVQSALRSSGALPCLRRINPLCGR